MDAELLELLNSFEEEGGFVEFVEELRRVDVSSAGWLERERQEKRGQERYDERLQDLTHYMWNGLREGGAGVQGFLSLLAEVQLSMASSFVDPVGGHARALPWLNADIWSLDEIVPRRPAQRALDEAFRSAHRRWFEDVYRGLAPHGYNLGSLAGQLIGASRFCLVTGRVYNVRGSAGAFCRRARYEVLSSSGELARLEVDLESTSWPPEPMELPAALERLGSGSVSEGGELHLRCPGLGARLRVHQGAALERDALRACFLVPLNGFERPFSVRYRMVSSGARTLASVLYLPFDMPLRDGECGERRPGERLLLAFDMVADWIAAAAAEVAGMRSGEAQVLEATSTRFGHSHNFDELPRLPRMIGVSVEALEKVETVRESCADQLSQLRTVEGRLRLFLMRSRRARRPRFKTRTLREILDGLPAYLDALIPFLPSDARTNGPALLKSLETQLAGLPDRSLCCDEDSLRLMLVQLVRNALVCASECDPAGRRLEVEWSDGELKVSNSIVSTRLEKARRLSQFVAARPLVGLSLVRDYDDFVVTHASWCQAYRSKMSLGTERDRGGVGIDVAWAVGLHDGAFTVDVGHRLVTVCVPFEPFLQGETDGS